mmetsp:Transcript_2891/g.10540  ORF Transcript_2891/g.10540 Transcript_2891/m.10540 type:complete len:187 (-) Transcript_2891:3185-3745(-)
MDKLQSNVDLLEARKREGDELISRGKKLFERSQYRKAIACFDEALDRGLVDKLTVQGGDALTWIGMSYQFMGKQMEARSVYCWLDDNHPSPRIRNQAMELLYILEAPELEIEEDERVKIPEIGGDDYSDKWAYRSGPTVRKPTRPKTWEEEFWDKYRPPAAFTNRYVQVASVVVGTALAIYSTALK